MFCILPQLSVDDGLPAQVCLQCVNQVNSSYTFKLQCENSDVTLRQLLDFQRTQVTLLIVQLFY